MAKTGDSLYYENDTVQCKELIQDTSNQSVDLSNNPSEKYAFESEIAYGGMKRIVKARDYNAARQVAMAIMDPSIPDNQKNRFIYEARIIANLEHPNIVPVYDIGIDNTKNPFFTMKLLQGDNLAIILGKLSEADPECEKKYPLQVLLEIILKVCDAISYAHSKGIVHLDLKPDNIHVGNYGEVLVLDWGLAKVIDTSKTEAGDSVSENLLDNLDDLGLDATLDGVIKGTPGFMAPEQASGKNREKDYRTDVYSLGAILYAILTLKRPLESSNSLIVVLKTAYGEITPPHKRTPDRSIPLALESICMKAMSTEPNERYQTVEEFRSRIEDYVSGLASGADERELLKHIGLYMIRHKVKTIIFFIIMLSLMAWLGNFFIKVKQHNKDKNDIPPQIQEMK